VCDRNGGGRQEDEWEKYIPARGATACHITGHRDVDADVARRHVGIWHANATRRGKFADPRPHNWAKHALPF